MEMSVVATKCIMGVGWLGQEDKNAPWLLAVESVVIEGRLNTGLGPLTERV